MKLGLERMRAQLDALGAPDRRLGAVVHVAGTNGKGSTVAMIAQAARNASKRVATYTSPHLSTLRERVTIDGELATEAQIVAAADGVDPDLTFFEQVTAIGLRIIADARPDITVLEVGLGGRLDATNAVAADIAVVTGVAMDHEAILGPTLADIAREKAGIFKPGQRAVIGRAGEPEAVPWLVEHARTAQVAELVVVDTPVDSPLAGAHQRANAAVAAAVARMLGIPADFTGTVHPGRFERAGDLILDGAHNPHGARALAATLRSLAIRPVLVIAASADKPLGELAAALEPAVSHVIATRYQQERSASPEQLAGCFAHAETAPALEHAVARARELGSPILIAGSLFLVGEARVRYLGAPADPVFVTDPSAGPAGSAAPPPTTSP
ncbi:MAG: bifunctional folylpolyglutamate synthase/dihydrofolate synthase [Deltaproteobacteria bacterium]|nr:bifunctional folylpolyglutamate synthase/dihydrofolate synthase [Deltaproteobacteria bacterium]